MKKNLILPLALGLLFSLGACEPKEEKPVGTDLVKVGDGEKKGGLPEMKFEHDRYDFGRITQGERVTHAFSFKNTGGSDLIISDASGSCGCTVPDWPKKPIPPGGEGVVNVQYNSEGKKGLEEKTVTLITNCEPNTIVLHISAQVQVPENRGGSAAGAETGGAIH